MDHVSRIIVNANHSIARAAEKLCVADGVAGCVWLAIPQRAEWQRVVDRSRDDLRAGGLRKIAVRVMKVS